MKFTPFGSVSLATSTTTTAARALPASSNALRLYNASVTPCWVEFGKSGVVAAIPADGTVDASGLMLAPNEVAFVDITPGITHYAAILPAGASAATLHAASVDVIIR